MSAIVGDGSDNESVDNDDGRRVVALKRSPEVVVALHPSVRTVGEGSMAGSRLIRQCFGLEADPRTGVTISETPDAHR